MKEIALDMTGYYSAITIIAVAVAGIMCTVPLNATMLGRRQKLQFLALFQGIVVATLCEWGGVMLDGSGEAARVFTPMLKFVEFSLAPALAVSFATILDRPHSRRIKFAGYALLAHAALELALIPFGLVFSVDSRGFYHHGPLYAIYIIAYVLSMAFLLYETKCFTSDTQFKGRAFPWLVISFLLGGLVIQTAIDGVRVIWLSIAIAAAMFYCFYCVAAMQVDSLTGLLNRSSFGGMLSSLDEEACILQIDVDGFKLVNDTYGHGRGDAVLHAVARILYDVYSEYATCFRTGGDEFCVIVTEDLDRVDALNFEFRRRLAVTVEDGMSLPGVSIGCVRYVPGEMSREDAVNEADARMYEDKRRRKAERPL